MRTKKQYSVITIFIFLAFFPVLSVMAGNPAALKKFVLAWNPPAMIRNGETPVEQILSFQGSMIRDEFGMLPVFMKSFPFDPETDSLADIVLSNQVYEKISEQDLSLVKGMDKLTGTIPLFHQLSVARKKTTLEVSLLPLRRNPATGLMERLVSFNLGCKVAKVNRPAGKSAGAWASNSVLASGLWYKLGVSADGIYRLSYEDLQKSGVDVTSIDPRNLRIYGNGGGMLPEANSAARIDDLMENAIFVYGEADGHFDPGDYLLFYGQGPDRWDYNKTDKLFHCAKNIYSDRMYYFLNFDKGPGKRITNQPSTTAAPTFYATRFEDFASYEKDEVNLIKSGRVWWDKQYFDITTVRNYSFSFPNLDTQTPVSLTTSLAARSVTGNTSFIVSAQGNALMTLDIDGVIDGFENAFANAKTGTATFLSASPVIDVKLSYNKSTSSSVGYLNYIELNAKRLLTMNGSQMLFRSAEGTAPGAVTEFTLNGNGQNVQIWDVTQSGDIRNILASQSGANYIFRLGTDTLRKFIAYDGGSFNVPEFTGRVENQDLHGTPVADYLIVSNPAFLGEAQRLAAFHQTTDGLSVFITTPDKIYNEFSSGAQDITAIRDFVRMMYNKAQPGKEPRYLLLFGDASYDFKNRTSDNTNFVPAYESAESLSPVSSFVSDDYFGLLDPNEGQSANGSLDIGVGRFPVDNAEEAKASVDKVIHYCSNSDSVKNDWRNVVTFVSDDRNVDEGNLFIESSEAIAVPVEETYKNYNVDKIYEDAYTMVSTPGGARYPEVNEAINKRVEKGSLIINYIGHGGEVGWAHERILEVADIQNWNNYDNMPVFVTATCEFSRFDDPGRVSAGEWVFLNGHGGGVALFTTTRLTFAGTNQTLLENFYANVFKKTSGSYMKMGDLLVASKTDMGSSANIHAFVLLGDPAMQMAYPDLNVVTTSINAHPPSAVPDTLKALSEVTITGEVRDLSGAKAVNFNGTVFPTVFDKSSEIWTKANQGTAPPVQFFLRKSPIYKGKVNVDHGSFSFSFIVPKDIAYKYGVGKISYYARSPETDANGFDQDIQVGGYNNGAIADNEGPQLALYINNRSFRSGGITSQDPVLLVDVSDTSGVNAVGNGIGHDITAVIDNKTATPMILNDYYVSDLNTFKSGEITYPLNSLSDGPHQVTVKVWDVHNNSTDATIDFTVVTSGEFAFQHLLSYPNPMQDHTTFSWETNQVDQPVEIEIRIFTLNGSPVKTLRQNYYVQGFRSASVQWDGTQDDGRKICSGLYVYSVQMMLPDGTAKRQTSKLVVIR